MLAPFFVLANPDWTKLDHTLNLLDHDRRDRLAERSQRALVPLDGGDRRVARVDLRPGGIKATRGPRIDEAIAREP